MSEAVYQNLGFLLWGVALGLFYFGGLWLTVRNLTIVKHLALRMMASLIIRNLVVVLGFYPVVLQSWYSTLYCLLGFILMRIILTRRIKVQFNESVKEL